MYSSIGEGSIAREDVVNHVKPKKSRLSSTLSLIKFSKKKEFNVDNKHAVPIKGLIAGMAVHYAKCCHPLPGDSIVGIMHSE